MAEIIVIDIETENIGYDVMGDNKRILSVQTYDGTDNAIYYNGSDTHDLSSAKRFLEEQIGMGTKFVGFNVKNFDVRFLREFLKVDIPSSQIIDIGAMPNMVPVKKEMRKDYPRLVDVCSFLDLECSHKNLMDDHSLQFKKRPEVIKMAQEAVEVWKKEKPWLTPDFAYNKH